MMMADKESPKKPMVNSKKKKKNKRGGAKRKITLEQTVAYKAVSEWVFLEQSNGGGGSSNSMSFGDGFIDDFGVQWYQPKEKLVFEFHCHTTCSDGFLSPTKLVERAHSKGVVELCLRLVWGKVTVKEAISSSDSFQDVVAATESGISERQGNIEKKELIMYYLGAFKWHVQDKFEVLQKLVKTNIGLQVVYSLRVVCPEQVKVLALTDHDTMSGVPEAMDAARRFGIKIIPGVEISTIFYSRGDSGPEEPVHILAYYSSCGPAKSAALEKVLGDIREGRFLRAKNIVSKLNKLKLPVKWENVAKIAGKGVAPGRLHIARAMLEAGHVENLKQAFTRYLYDGGPAYCTGSEPVAEETVQLIRETGGVAVLAHPWALKNPGAIIRRLKEAGLHGIEVYRSDGKLSVYSDLADAHDLLKLGGSDYHGRGDNTNPIASELINQCLSLWLSKEERENAEFETIKLELDRAQVVCGELEIVSYILMSRLKPRPQLDRLKIFPAVLYTSTTESSSPTQ
ncbi:hypothetical protein DH2020_011156 [Rehmannia glutinosa]|uniref:Polymerase/histidinol phosphatase N-terminal domain-containing protein n=1 Tax=Rehmannia glutinosa TaxID=99300 RepID=A0ABR0XCI0_REHGL